MGVKGLWRLLLPIGRRINIETLEGQILAIDASIWITQFIKAMRDQESGAVRPAAHLIGFFRRICRLRYHGIRPVFVFDGATPEIKRRELALRRKRRDQFVATHGTAAVQRLAKRLLVEQLKKQSKGKEGGRGTKTMVGGDQSVRIIQSGNNDDGGGAFAAGFNLPESEQGKAQTSEDFRNTGNTKDKDRNHDDSTDARYEIIDGEVMIVSGSGIASQERNAKEGSPPQAAAIGDDVNDWDKAVIDVDMDEDENDENNSNSDNSDNEEIEYDDVLWTSQKSKRRKRKNQNQRLGIKNSSREFFDAEYVLSLDPVDRKEAIENAKKKQRLKSRGEFMPVAANAMEYSQAQVRNFLRSTQLNKDIVTMAKQAVKNDSKNHNGERVASDHTQRVFFEKDDNGEGNDDGSSYASEEDDEDSDDGGFLRTEKRPTHARRLASKQQGQNSPEEVQRRHRFRKAGDSPGKPTSSNVDSDDEEGGGFFAETSNTTVKSPVTASITKSIKRRAVVDDTDSSDESNGGGGFISTTGTSKTCAATAAASTTAMGKGEDDSESSEGVGFMTANIKATKPSLSGGGGYVHSSKKVAFSAKKTETSSHAARRVQFEEDDDTSDAGSSVDKASSNKTVRRPKSFKPILYSAGAAKAAAGALFRPSTDAGSGDDDSSQDGGGFLRGNPVINGGRLKSTGLEDEVVVIDGDGNRPLSGDALKAQELQDEMIAKALQEEEDAPIAASYSSAGLNETQSAEATCVDGISGNSHATKEKGPSLEMIEAHGAKNDNNGQASENIQYKDTITSSGVFLAGDDGSEDDEDIDWENGDSSGDEMKKVEVALPQEKESPEVGAMDTKMYDTMKKDTVAIAVAVDSSHSKREHTIGPFVSVEHNHEDSDNVEWQDGDCTNVEEDAAQMQHVKDKEKQLPASSPTRQTMTNSERKDEALNEEADMDVDLGLNDFGGSPKTENKAALVQAQATAANLTNWAGRAVRRAIAEHLGAENITETPESISLEKIQNESDDTDVEIVESISGNKSPTKAADDHNLVVNEEHAEEAAEMLQQYENDLANTGNNNIEREIEGVTDEIEEEVMQLLQLFGVPYIRAPAEAEAQCAMLEKLGLVNGIVVRENVLPNA